MRTLDIERRFSPWSSSLYGTITPPGVIARHTLLMDGREESHIDGDWYPTEQGFRWTGRCVVVRLLRQKGHHTLAIELSSGPEALGPVCVAVRIGSDTVTRTISTDSWTTLSFKLPTTTRECSIVSVILTVEQLRRADLLGNNDPRELGVAVRAVRLLGRSSAHDFPLSSICNPEHWHDPRWYAFLRSLGIADVQHRKLWEWVHGIAGLSRLGCLTPSARALGVAAGHEPVIYWLAHRVAEVYATDLYQGAFASHEANPDVLHNPEKYAPYPYPQEKVHFLPMSGTDVCFQDESFDFIFSFCSIEHFGSRANSCQSLQEMARVLRPGGIAAVSTEVLLNDFEPQEEIFTPWELYERIIAPSGLLLLGEIAPANITLHPPVDMSQTLVANHQFVLHDQGMLFTSVMLFLQKPDNAFPPEMK